MGELSYFRKIGPEPLTKSFNAKWVLQQSQTRSIPIKQFLLDHQFVAGIGNIYASEILFEAGIHPLTPANQITLNQADQLCRQSARILKEAIRLRGCSMRNYRDGGGNEGGYKEYTRVYAKEGLPCPKKDGGVIQKEVIGQRSAFFCPVCQQ